ncbi:YegP family protein [Herminiimonas sp. NPDC097707]|uniref:YegP family protein n=1 Tax=Herminiimonas sp. NPDC097707 TaxID=3364007 RepID=UPI00383B3840
MADLSYPYFYLYKDVSGQWRWNIRARNHKVIADSSESYVNKTDALHGIELVKNASNVYDSTTEKWV